MSTFDPKSHWVPDSHSTECFNCKTKFTKVTRKHHCRLCGEIFCETCTQCKITLENIGIKNKRGCDKCNLLINKHIPLLKNQNQFIRFERSGSQHPILFQLSDDQNDFLVIYEEGTKLPKTFAAESLMRILDGQVTDTWAVHQGGCCFFGGNSVTQDEDICFSICFAEGTVDVKCGSITIKMAYIEAIQSYFALLSSNGGMMLKEGRRHYKEVDEQNKIEEIQKKNREQVHKKYDKLRKGYEKKYGTFE